MKRSSKVLIVVLILVVVAGCGIGAYFLFRDKFDSASGNGGDKSGTISSPYDGMYYYYISGTYYKTEYIKLKGNKWASADGDNGTYKVEGTDITLYKSVMGDNEVILSGTIEDGIITVKQDIAGISMNTYYCQDGKVPN